MLKLTHKVVCVYLNALQLNGNALFVFDGTVLSLSKLMWQSHIF